MNLLLNNGPIQGLGNKTKCKVCISLFVESINLLLDFKSKVGNNWGLCKNNNFNESGNHPIKHLKIICFWNLKVDQSLALWMTDQLRGSKMFN